MGSEENGNCWSRLFFDGDEAKYKICENKFLGHARSKDTVLGVNPIEDGNDNERNEEAYVELVQFLYDKSNLSLITREAADNGGRKP